jgi:broad specificity phosphatase PhoE
MFRILLIRPGVTEYDQQRRIQGTLDIPICEDGRRQVEAMVGELRTQPVEAIYTSPAQCAVQTAESLGEALDLKVKEIDKLQNLNHGLWQGMLIKDVKTKQPKVFKQWQEQPETICPPQGETVGAAEERLQAVVAKLVKKHKSEGLIAIVVPEPLASLLCHVLRDGELGDLWRSRDKVAAWEVIDVTTNAIGSK